MLHKIFNRFTLVLFSVLLIAGCSSQVEPVKTQVVYEDRIVTHTEYKVIKPSKTLYRACKKPKPVKELLDYTNPALSEDDLFNAFKDVYLNYAECYKAIKSIESFVTKAATTYEAK